MCALLGGIIRIGLIIRELNVWNIEVSGWYDSENF